MLFTCQLEDRRKGTKMTTEQAVNITLEVENYNLINREMFLN